MPAFVFDIDDTMYDRLTPFRLAFTERFGGRQELGFDCSDLSEMRSLFRAFIRRGNQVFEDAMSQRITMEEMYVFRIQKALEDFGMAITRQESLDFQTAYAWQQSHIQLSPALSGMLDLCRERGAFLGIITNGPSLHQRDKCRALGLERWIEEDHVLASGDIGINKPDPRIFHRAAARWQLSPGETWYVGDSYEHDIVSASQAGWHTIWLRRAGHDHGHSEAEAPSNQKENPDTTADLTVTSEEELLGCVRRLLV